MPFAGYENFAACVADQKTQGHGDEAARKICGALERDTKPYEGRSAGRAASRYNKSGAGKYKQKSAGYYKQALKAVKTLAMKTAVDSSALPNSVANSKQGVGSKGAYKKLASIAMAVEKGGVGSGRKKGSKDKKKRKKRSPSKKALAGGTLQKDYRNPVEA